MVSRSHLCCFSCFDPYQPENKINLHCLMLWQSPGPHSQTPDTFHGLHSKAPSNLINFHLSIAVPPKGKRTSLTRLELIQSIIIHIEELLDCNLVTGWGWHYQTREGDEDDVSRAWWHRTDRPDQGAHWKLTEDGELLCSLAGIVCDATFWAQKRAFKWPLLLIILCKCMYICAFRASTRCYAGFWVSFLTQNKHPLSMHSNLNQLNFDKSRTRIWKWRIYGILF